MKELVEQMKKVLATNFAFYLKCHNFHWNVEGPNFPQYHKFLDKLYKEIWEAVDSIGEEIRTLDAYAPASLSRYQTLSSIADQLNIPSAMKMIKELEMDNDTLIEELRKANDLAEKEKCIGLANFLQERIDIHYKHKWMLRSITKG
jgi:starvation-inducible DNA-binding protein